MPRDLLAYLWDIEGASGSILKFAEGKTIDDYRSDQMLSAAIERKFEIIGEAMAQLSQHYPHVATHISNHKRFIAFRNVLIHRYANIEDENVWLAVDASVPALRENIIR